MTPPDLHPSPETLAAYHRGELAPADAESVLEHVATCRHCADLLLDLPSFLALAPPVQASADAAETAKQPAVNGEEDEEDAAWRAIAARMPAPPLASTVSPRAPAAATLPARRPWRPSSPGRFWNPLAAAALFAGLAVVATPLWMVARRLATPAELPPATLDLSPADVPRGQSGAASRVALIHSQAASTTLVLRLALAQRDLRFRVELTAATVAARPGMAPNAAAAAPAFTVVDSRTIVVVLARGQLAVGPYRLRVLDATAAPSAAPLGAYELEVADP